MTKTESIMCFVKSKVLNVIRERRKAIKEQYYLLDDSQKKLKKELMLRLDELDIINIKLGDILRKW
jgi:hypothetical protein